MCIRDSTTHSPSTWIPPPPLFQPYLLRCRMTSMTRRFLNQPSASDVNRWPKTFKTLPNAHIGFGKIWTKIWSDDLHDPILDSLENQSQSLSSSVELTWADRSSSSMMIHHVNLSFHSTMYYHIITSLSHCPMSLSTSQELAWEDRSRGLRQNWPVGNS